MQGTAFCGRSNTTPEINLDIRWAQSDETWARRAIATTSTWIADCRELRGHCALIREYVARARLARAASLAYFL